MMTFTTIPTTPLPSGEAVTILGQGTWGVAEDPRRRQAAVATLGFGLDGGMTLLDTAEMYGEGVPKRSLLRRSLDAVIRCSSSVISKHWSRYLWVQSSQRIKSCTLCCVEVVRGIYCPGAET
jgi:aryl-alcohol dehydrogenase-like predicted oxidoreductase